MWRRRKQKPQENPRRWPWLTLVVSFAHVAGFLTSIDAIMSVRTPQGTVAWAVVLNTFPYVSVPAYWIFGRSEFQGYVNLRRDEDEDIGEYVERARREAGEHAVRLEAGSGELQALERLAELPFTTGNQAELLIDGTATFDSILDGIDAAEDYVLVQFFIVKDDSLGRRLKDALIAKALAGVRVYFLYDGLGSIGLPTSYTQELNDAGAEALGFYTTAGAGNRFRLNFRNHRKIVIVDGETAWIGGHNVGDEYLGLDPGFGAWRDTHLKIQGPAVTAAQLAFLEDWHWAADAVPVLNWEVAGTPLGQPSIKTLILASGPADVRETAGLFFTHAINSARQRIWIASPYFVPDESVMSAIHLALLRGVDVRILIPDDPDHYVVYLAAFSFLDEFSDTNLRIYRYTDGFMHQKTLLIDDTVAAVGTANLDNRSFRLNFEITAVLIDEAFARQVERMFEEDFRRSRVMAPDEYESRSFLFRLAVRTARLMAPVL